jgi:hypothetical protein
MKTAFGGRNTKQKASAFADAFCKGRSKPIFSRSQKTPQSGGPKPKPSDSGFGLERRSNKMSAL